jgi:hypothetical protein
VRVERGGEEGKRTCQVGEMVIGKEAGDARTLRLSWAGFKQDRTEV